MGVSLAGRPLRRRIDAVARDTASLNAGQSHAVWAFWPMHPTTGAADGAGMDDQISRAWRERLPVAIDSSGRIESGGQEASFQPGDAYSLIDAYLQLIADLRAEPLESALDLRTIDIDELARYLKASGHLVLEIVAEMLGTDPEDRRGVVESYLAGADTLSVPLPAGR